jgi:anti-sigma factor RsiW
MSCSPFDLRDYFFGELAEEDRQQVELHSRSCLTCREELNRLRSMQAALLAVADEEIPQRIGFVSDRVYEPSLVRRWWRGFWGSAPRLGFAAAAMLSVAIIVSAMHRPAVVTPPASVDIAKLQADFSRQLNESVQKAVAESDARHERLLAAAARRFDLERKADIERVSQNFAILDKYVRRDVRASILGDTQ